MNFFPFAFQPPSEEEQAEMKKAHERHQMAVEEFKHSSQRMFEELSEDHLRTLKTMLHIIVDRTSDPIVAQWEGMVATYLKIKHGVCITCNVNHDHEAPRPSEQQDKEAREPWPIVDLQDSEPPHFTCPDCGAKSYNKNDIENNYCGNCHEFKNSWGGINQDDLTPGMKVNGPLVFPDSVLNTMREYHLDDAYEESEEGLHFKGFACTGIKGMRGQGCGVIYPTIEDRKLKGPEECSGCHRRMAQG